MKISNENIKISWRNVLIEENLRAMARGFWTIWWVSQAIRLTPLIHTRQDTIRS